MVAVVEHNINVAKVLLEYGADVNAVDEYNGHDNQNDDKFLRRASRFSEFNEHLRPGADFRGCTALHYAVLVDDESLVEILLDSGADPTIRNELGFLPIHYCKSPSIAKLLESGNVTPPSRAKPKDSQPRIRIPLEQRLRDNIVGQESAIEIVTAAIRRKEKGWHDDDHPLVMLFMGSSGVGKTEIAKQVAYHLHPGNASAFVRLDMSEYQEKHEVSKLFGAPPGYVGHDAGGQLTNALLRNPNAVVLFDEIEKAHPDVMAALLQLFDEGRLTSGTGVTVNCKEAIFIMTSNVGSRVIAEHAQLLREKTGDAASNIKFSRDFLDKVMRPLLRKHFVRDEFLGRINEVVYFLPFSPKELNELVLRYLDFWREKAYSKHGISLSWDQDVVDLIIAGYDVYYGARSIAFEIDRQIISRLAVADERGQLKPNSDVHLKVVKPSSKDGPDIIPSSSPRVELVIKEKSTEASLSARVAK
ncbi:hypothetical protein Aperf_G00000075049 [Anoplocephala perfoliata]